MSHRGRPFAVESPLPPHLDGLLAYWKDLCRGQADMPFADDIDMNRVRELVSDSFTLGVFAKPARYRMELARTPRAPVVEADLPDRFIDEVALPSPLEYLRAQAEATVEGMGPTIYAHDHDGVAYQRLLLPAWGEGQVKLLLGAVEYR
ncbi:MAG: hypothetical protein JSR86_02710 [Proteobacteria bacterium]|nr:hypothetical protein [Pseudomonadota bacterium]